MIVILILPVTITTRIRHTNKKQQKTTTLSTTRKPLPPTTKPTFPGEIRRTYAPDTLCTVPIVAYGNGETE